MIHLDHISKIFPTADGELKALSNVDLTIGDGSVFGIGDLFNKCETFIVCDAG